MAAPVPFFYQRLFVCSPLLANPRFCLSVLVFKKDGMKFRVRFFIRSFGFYAKIISIFDEVILMRGICVKAEGIILCMR